MCACATTLIFVLHRIRKLSWVNTTTKEDLSAEPYRPGSTCIFQALEPKSTRIFYIRTEICRIPTHANGFTLVLFSLRVSKITKS